jgi:predicted transcriptional regulator
MADSTANRSTDEELLAMTAEIVAAYLSRNATVSAKLPEVVATVYDSLRNLEAKGDTIGTLAKPAVPIKRSVTPEYLVCLEDGRKLKMLKRHLRSAYNLTPDGYRQKWGLPADYPMVAPNYAEARSDFAKKIGLGKRAGAKRGKK